MAAALPTWADWRYGHRGTPMIRPVAAGEAEALRELRLRALVDSPEAFVSDVESESAHEPAHWEQLTAGGDERIVLVAQDEGGRLAGMVGGGWFDRERGIAHLWGLWVEPAIRGSGVGAALVRGILEWAVGAGAGSVRLGVIDPGGDGTTAFYRRLGFVALDEPVPLRADPSRSVTYMIRSV